MVRTVEAKIRFKDSGEEETVLFAESENEIASIDGEVFFYVDSVDELVANVGKDTGEDFIVLYVATEEKLYFGYVRYEDGCTMCHAKGTLAEVMESEKRVEEASKVRVKEFKRNEVNREFFELHR